mmetsp:Transcript_25516/g.82214  ORF Transcript_25516/g.82214 Transcript_25516/m.82214 type:complete len:228 (+) Transcript_25516:566-1249(+)
MLGGRRGRRPLGHDARPAPHLSSKTSMMGSQTSRVCPSTCSSPHAQPGTRMPLSPPRVSRTGPHLFPSASPLLLPLHQALDEAHDQAWYARSLAHAAFASPPQCRFPFLSISSGRSSPSSTHAPCAHAPLFAPSWRCFPTTTRSGAPSVRPPSRRICLTRGRGTGRPSLRGVRAPGSATRNTCVDGAKVSQVATPCQSHSSQKATNSAAHTTRLFSPPHPQGLSVSV